jgi:hypothetical protein
MAESIEVQLKELSGSELKHWANPTIESFEIKDARFLLLDLRPTPFDRRTQALPRHVQDTERRLREWLGKNGHNGFLERVETTNKKRNDWIARGTSLEDDLIPIKKTIPAKPIPRETLTAAAESLGLRPKFLFLIESEHCLSNFDEVSEINHDDEGIMFYRLLVAMAIDAYGYDPADPKQGQRIMKGIQGSLDRQGWPNKQDRIKPILERAVSKSGWKPRQS